MLSGLERAATPPATRFSGALSRVLAELGFHKADQQPQLIDGPVEATKTLLLAKAASSGARVLCRYIPHQESQPPVAGMAPQLYDRSAIPAGGKGCELQGYRIRAGETFTTLCINKPGVPGQISHQHCNWLSYFAPD